MIDSQQQLVEDDGKSGSARMCAVSRAVRPRSELLRFVASPQGTVVADLKAKLPGRGVWVGLDRDLVAQAVRRNVFQRGLKVPIAAAADLPDQVATQLKDSVSGRLGLARKAGAVVTGFAKVEAAIAKTPLAALLIASDAAEDSCRKIEQALFRRFGANSALPMFRAFSAAELSLATGQPHVIHAAVLQGPAGRSFVEAAIRFQHYQGVRSGGASDRAVGQDVTNE